MLNDFQRTMIERARLAAARLPPCVHCGQSFGGLLPLGSDATGRTRAHTRCHALAVRGLPLPTWRRCGACWGLGLLPRSSVGPINPGPAALAAWAPGCEICEGRGWLE